ncbi:hypothetical protein FVE85_6348 [Porphyridium purpureum]|uniref:Uncharacterized protein n=1 Tax=Porphyridium purpureum TaxID=35688 RepID=A0A5J4Z7G2_PORPP|nr:hypothetical protein FVE85_6348 [Porphyridium purpureum]|eukprot:POR7785..scf295_1
MDFADVYYSDMSGSASPRCHGVDVTEFDVTAVSWENVLLRRAKSRPRASESAAGLSHRAESLPAVSENRCPSGDSCERASHSRLANLPLQLFGAPPSSRNSASSPPCGASLASPKLQERLQSRSRSRSQSRVSPRTPDEAIRRARPVELERLDIN